MLHLQSKKLRYWSNENTFLNWMKDFTDLLIPVQSLGDRLLRSLFWLVHINGIASHSPPNMNAIWMTSVYATENIPPTNVYDTATAALNTTESLMSISRITLNVVPKRIFLSEISAFLYIFGKIFCICSNSKWIVPYLTSEIPFYCEWLMQNG